MRKTGDTKKKGTTFELASAFAGLSQHQIGQLWWQAVKSKNYSAMKKIGKAGFDINTIGGSHDAPALTQAAEAGDLETVKALVAMPGINVNHLGTYKGTALSSAAENGHVEIVRLLLGVPSIDVNIPAGDNQHAPIFEALFAGHEKIASLLLSHKDIDRNVRVSGGWEDERAAFHVAAGRGYVEIVKQFLDDPSLDVNMTARGRGVGEGIGDVGVTALHEAAENGQAEVVKFLLSKGADVNKSTESGVTPLMALVKDIHVKDKVKRIETIKALLDAPGIDVNARETGRRNTALLFAAGCYDHKDRGLNEIVKELLKTPKIDVNLVNDSHETPLMLAAGNGHDGVVEQLLAVPGIDLNKKNDRGKFCKVSDALSYAEVHGHPSNVKILLATPGINAKNHRKAVRSKVTKEAALRRAQAVLQM